MPIEEAANHMQTYINAYLFERIKEETKKYVSNLNSRSDSPYFSEFDRSIMLLTNVPEHYADT